MASLFDRLFNRGGPNKNKMREAAALRAKFDKAKTGIDTILGQTRSDVDFRNVRADVTQKVLDDNARRQGTEDKRHPYEGRGFNDISNKAVSELYPHKDDIIEDMGVMRAGVRDITEENLQAGHAAARAEFEAYLGDEKGAEAFAKYAEFAGRSDAAKTMRYFEMEKEYKMVMNNALLAIRSTPNGQSMTDIAEAKINGLAAANKADLAGIIGVDVADKKIQPLLDKYATPHAVMEMGAYDPNKPQNLALKVEFAQQHGQMIDVAMRELHTASPDESRGLYDVVKTRMGETFEKGPSKAPEPEIDDRGR